MDGEERGERIDALLEDLRSALVPVHHGDDAHDLGLVGLGRLGCDQSALAAGDDVVEDGHPLVTGEVALDLAARAMVLRAAPHEEALQWTAGLGAVQHQAGDQRVGPHGESPDGGDALRLQQLPEQPRDPLQALRVEAGLADIDIVVGGDTRAEDEFAEAHGALEQHPAEVFAVRTLQDPSEDRITVSFH